MARSAITEFNSCPCFYVGFGWSVSLQWQAFCMQCLKFSRQSL